MFYLSSNRNLYIKWIASFFKVTHEWLLICLVMKWTNYLELMDTNQVTSLISPWLIIAQFKIWSVSDANFLSPYLIYLWIAQWGANLCLRLFLHRLKLHLLNVFITCWDTAPNPNHRLVFQWFITTVNTPTLSISHLSIAQDTLEGGPTL